MSGLRLALSMGDAAGVGPELCCRVCADPQFDAYELIVYGNKRVLERVAEKLNLIIPQNIVDINCPEADTIQAGQLQVASGALAGSRVAQRRKLGVSAGPSTSSPPIGTPLAIERATPCGESSHASDSAAPAKTRTEIRGPDVANVSLRRKAS